MQRGALLMRLGLFQSCSKVCNLQISTWVDNATLSIEPNFFFFGQPRSEHFPAGQQKLIVRSLPPLPEVGSFQDNRLLSLSLLSHSWAPTAEVTSSSPNAKYLDRLTEELAGSVLVVIWFHRRKQGFIQLVVWSSCLVLTSQLCIHFTPQWQQGLTDLSSYHWILGMGVGGKKSERGRKSGSFGVRILSPTPPLSLSFFHTHTHTLSLSLSYLWLLLLLLLAAVKWRAITDPMSFPLLPTLLKLN